VGQHFPKWTALQIFAVNQRSADMWKKVTGVLLAIGFAGLTWAQQIDLNKATEVELDALKGVGPVLTKAVMDERKKAPFKDWEDATNRVKGLGTQKAISLSEQGVRVQGSAYTGKATEKKPVKAADAAKDAPKDSGKAAPKNADASAAKASPTKN
jgi:competence protein ComEA